MRRYIYIRMLCLLLVFAALAPGFSACAPAATPVPEGQRLSVTAQAVGYSAEFASSIAARMVDPICRMIYLSGGPLLTDVERAALYDRLRGYFLPAAARASVMQEELEQLLVAAQVYCTALEESEGAKARLFAFCDFYQHAVATVGTERTGQLLMYGATFYLNEQITVCESRYFEYGYEYLRQDAEKYRNRLTQMQAQLSADHFTDAASVFLLVGSFATGVLPEEDSAALLYDGDILLVLQLQANKFANFDVSAEQWHLLIELLGDCRSKTPDTAGEAVWAALQETGDNARLAELMPALLALYAAVASHLTPADITTLRSEGAETEKSRVISRALVKSDATLAALLDAFETAAAALHTAEHERAVQAIGMSADCAAFLQETSPIDRAAFLARITACANGAEVDVLAAVRAYLCGQAPYLAYAIFLEE